MSLGLILVIADRWQFCSLRLAAWPRRQLTTADHLSNGSFRCRFSVRESDLGFRRGDKRRLDGAPAIDGPQHVHYRFVQMALQIAVK